MSDQPPEDSTAQHQAYGQPGHQPHQQPPPPPQPPPGAAGYGQPYAPGPAPGPGPGYPPPRKPLDLAKLVSIAGWVVLGLFCVYYFYVLTNDDYGGDFADRFFGEMPTLATGMFYASVTHAVAVWLRRNQWLS